MAFGRATAFENQRFSGVFRGYRMKHEMRSTGLKITAGQLSLTDATCFVIVGNLR